MIMPSSRLTSAAITSQSGTSFPPPFLCGLGAWLRRGLAALRWLGSKAQRSVRRLGLPGVEKTNAWTIWYNELYRSLGEHALQFGQPGERMPELILHDLEG